jgi:molybdenum cofactor cytidylyltransferase
MTIAGVILAAGRGTRFGGDKLLARLPNGMTIIEQTAQRLSAAVDETVCVLRVDDVRLQQHLTTLGVRWTVAPAAEQGMSQSLQTGIAHFPQADAWLIGLGDMPYVTTATYRALCHRFRDLEALAADDHHRLAGDGEGWIVVPSVIQTATGRSQRGNPVLFSRHFSAELNQLTGDVGGKAVINGHPERVVMVAVGDASILQDIDRLEDIR